MSPAAVQFKDVWKAFGPDREVFRGLTTEVPAAGVTFVVGRSGVGKSVLCRLAVGLERPDRGAISLFGERVDGQGERALLALRRRAPYLVQGPALLDWMTLAQNVALAHPQRLAEPALNALKRVGLRDLADRRPTELGPGIRKRAAIARALVLEPRFLMFDEPTTGLDKSSAGQVADVLADLRAEGLGAMVVSHDYPLLERIADRVLLVVDEGARTFSTAKAFLSSDDEEARALLEPVRSELGSHG